MSALERLLAGVLLAIALAGVGWLGLHHYGAAQHDAGYAEAIAMGKVQHDRDIDQARRTENDLRQTLAEKDAEAFQKDQDHAQTLAAAERRMRAGTDRLRCPTSTVQPAAAPAAGPATSGPPADGEGPSIVPEAAADVLSIAADAARLVRQYDRVVERFEACRAVNAK